MEEVTIWHNPKCSKSREAMDILQESGCESRVFEYLKRSPNESEIRAVLKMLGVSPIEMMRTKEELFSELNLGSESNDEALIMAMAEHPKLIERPIIIKGDKAIIGRPTEKIALFLSKEKK